MGAPFRIVLKKTHRILKKKKNTTYNSVCQYEKNVLV